MPVLYAYSQPKRRTGQQNACEWRVILLCDSVCHLSAGTFRVGLGDPILIGMEARLPYVQLHRIRLSAAVRTNPSP